MPFDVVCAGIIVVDHVAAPVDHLPAAGELVLTDECLLTIGGCASNVAVDLSKQQITTTVAGCVGDDSFGEFAKSVLRAHGLDTAGIATIPSVSTSQTLILNVRGQDRRFIHHLGANRVFHAGLLPMDQIVQARVLYVGGYFLMASLTPESLADVFARAQRAGVTTVLDVVTPGPLDYARALETLLPVTDVFLPNHDEARMMGGGGSDPVEQAETFRKHGAKTVVITQGGDGAVLLSPTHRLRARAFEVEFVDGTGGGDAFDAGFIRGLLEGAGPERCLELGSALGASCVRRPGATAGVFTRDEVDRYLAEHRLVIEPIP